MLSVTMGEVYERAIGMSLLSSVPRYAHWCIGIAISMFKYVGHQ